MVNFLATQNIEYAVTSRRKAFLISTPRQSVAPQRWCGRERTGHEMPKLPAAGPAAALARVARRERALGHARAHEWRDLGAEQLDRPHHRAMRQAHQIDEISRVPEDFVLEEDLLRHRLRIADEERAAWTSQQVVLRTRRRCPAALEPDLAHRRLVTRPVFLCRSCRALGY